MQPKPNTTGTYCSFRSRRNCVGGVVDFIVKTRVRRGKVEKFTYYLCEHHTKTVSRPPA